MSDIFREVDEALQQEKMAKIWKEYGPTLVLAAILMVLTTGLTTAYRAWDSSRNQQETAKLVLASEQKDIASAMEKAAGDSRDGHKAIAFLNAAAKYADKKDFTKAATLYKELADDSSIPHDLRDLSSIFYVRAALLAPGKAPALDSLIQRLLPIDGNDRSPFQKQAKLETALLYGNGMKDYTKALELLKGFGEETGEDSLNEKAAALTHLYEHEQSTAQKPAAQE